MRRTVRLSLIGLSSSLLSCTSALSPSEALELAQAERRWAARPFQSYSFDYQDVCVCTRDDRLMRISVDNGHVVGVVYLANDSAVAPEHWHFFPTIDTLFAEIGRLSHADWVNDVRVEYDPALGYPRRIDTIVVPADGAGTEYVRNLLSAP